MNKTEEMAAKTGSSGYTLDSYTGRVTCDGEPIVLLACNRCGFLKATTESAYLGNLVPACGCAESLALIELSVEPVSKEELTRRILGGRPAAAVPKSEPAPPSGVPQDESGTAPEMGDVYRFTLDGKTLTGNFATKKAAGEAVAAENRGKKNAPDIETASSGVSQACRLPYHSYKRSIWVTASCVNEARQKAAAKAIRRHSIIHAGTTARPVSYAPLDGGATRNFASLVDGWKTVVAETGEDIDYYRLAHMCLNGGGVAGKGRWKYTTPAIVRRRKHAKRS